MNIKNPTGSTDIGACMMDIPYPIMEGRNSRKLHVEFGDTESQAQKTVEALKDRVKDLEWELRQATDSNQEAAAEAAHIAVVGMVEKLKEKHDECAEFEQRNVTLEGQIVGDERAYSALLESKGKLQNELDAAGKILNTLSNSCGSGYNNLPTRLAEILIKNFTYTGGNK